MSRLSTLVRASSGRGGQVLRALHADMTAALPIRRRIGVAALSPGVGTSTAAVEIASMITAVRGHRVLLVQAGVTATAPPVPPDAADVVHHVVPGQSHAVGVDMWWGHASAAIQQNELTVTDWGHRDHHELVSIAHGGHALCLVAAAQRDAIQQALDMAAALHAHTPVCLLAVDTSGEKIPAVSTVLRNLPFTAGQLRFDARRAPGAPCPRPRRRGDSESLLRVCASLVTATGSSGSR